MTPSRSHLLGYAVVVFTGICLAFTIYSDSAMWRAVSMAAGFAAGAGYYNGREAGLRLRYRSTFADLENFLRNKLQAIRYASYLRKLYPARKVDEIVEIEINAVTLELVRATGDFPVVQEDRVLRGDCMALEGSRAGVTDESAQPKRLPGSAQRAKRAGAA